MANRRHAHIPPKRGPNPPPGKQGSGRPGIEERLRSSETVRYFADQKREAIRPELLDEEAERVAKLMRDIPASQLRRFFGAVMELKRRLEADPKLRANGELIRAELAFLKASSAYAAKRLGYDKPQKNKTEGWQGDPLELVRFFARHRNSVRDDRDFEAFARHFEAVMAFHKCYAPER